MIELLGGYCIKSDRKQFIMGQTRKDKAGHTRFKEPHYFSTMQGAVKEAIRRLLCEKVAGDEITTLRQFVEDVYKRQPLCFYYSRIFSYCQCRSA